ncbi:MAG: T9SS type A sorting domain-containing protein [Psychroserpens sp.]|nr:T9SS type A sorting domain-containing protein [Psychroserpens sp.]
MNLKRLVFVLVLSFVSNLNFAQECAFDSQRELLRQNPNFVEQEQKFEEKIKNLITSDNFQNRNGSNVLTVPMVVHVLHLGETEGTGTNISDAQIQSCIDNLNYFYRGQSPASPLDFEIEFALAQRDPNCNPTTGIIRIDASGVPNYSASGVSFAGGPGADQNTLKDLSRWPESDYFNVWIVTEINNNNGGSGFQGYANFYFGNAYEGSVMMHTVFGYDPTNANPSWPLNFLRDNSTVVHEAGHYFHLYHTFQGDDTNNDGVSDACPADVTVGVDSDGCADTVPHQRETSTCPATNTCTGNPWVDDLTINNIMGYYWCTDLMSDDQKTRVRAAMEGTSLVNSLGGEAPDPSYAPPVAACTTNTASANNFAGIFSVELNGNTFTSSTTGIDGGNLDYSGNCSNYFQIDTSVSNTLNVETSVNFHQLGVWIDWNDDGDFDDDAEQQIFVQDIPASSTTPIVLTYPTNIPYNDYVRLRIVDELDDRYGGVGLINSPCYQSLVYGQSEDYTIFIEPASSTTYTFNNGWAPSDPTGVSLMTDMIDVVSGDVVIAANTQCDRLTVEAGASVTVNSGITMTTTTVEMNSTSSSFSSIIVDGTLTGNVKYNRYTSEIAPVGTNDLISAPVSGQTFGAFEAANANLPSSGTTHAFAPYDTSLGAFTNYDSVANAATPITSGIGYRTATTDGSPLVFTGTVLSSDVLDIPISDDEAGDAWNLIGNPYASYIDFNDFFVANQTQFDGASAYQAIYGYDGDVSNGWTVWNQASIFDNAVTERIAPGQAFFVKAKTAGGLVDFTTTMRRTGSSDDFIVGRYAESNPMNIALSKLFLFSSSNNAHTSIYFIDGASRGLDDGYDAGSYQGVSGEFSIFTHLLEDNEGLDITIQSLAYNDFNDVVIPLGIKAAPNQPLTIGLDDLSTLPPSVNVYLEDTELNTLTLLNDNDYTFNPPVNVGGIGRFYLRYSSDTLSELSDQLDHIMIYLDTNKDIMIKGQIPANCKATLYDIQGRVVLTDLLNNNATTNRIGVSQMSTGVYIIQLSDGNMTRTQKLVIR